MTRKMTVLIQGAGIGGLTLAYWLHRYGFVPTVVERAPSLREGGQVIDFFGLGLDIAERMSVRSKIVSHDLRVEEIAFVDSQDRRRGGVDAHYLREHLDQRSFTVLRGVLARTLFDVVKDDVELVFSDTATALEQTQLGVDVSFAKGKARNFDIVIGADGLHSGIRGLVFGDEREFERYLGYYAASFTLPAPDDAQSFACHTRPGRQVAVYPLEGGRLAVFFVFSARNRLDYERQDTAAQVALLRAAFADVGWRAPELLERASDADDFHFDVVSQIRMPTWSKDRVSLIGDACCCPSLLSGQGASLAMTCAYVLAGELNASAGGFRSGFNTYEQIMKPYVEARQAVAGRAASSLVPGTRLGIAMRDLTTRASALRPFMSYFVSRLSKDTLELRRYEETA